MTCENCHQFIEIEGAYDLNCNSIGRCGIDISIGFICSNGSCENPISYIEPVFFKGI